MTRQRPSLCLLALSSRLGINIIDNALANKRMYFVYRNWAKMLIIVSTRDSSVTIYM